MELIGLPGGRVYTPEKGDLFFSRPVPSGEPGPDATVVDVSELVDGKTGEKRWKPLEAQPDAAKLVPRRQRGQLWFEERWGALTGSKISKFLGWTFGPRSDEATIACIRAMREELVEEMGCRFGSVARGLKFDSPRDEAIGRERMAWGTVREDDALATLLHHFPTLMLRECVLQRLPGQKDDAAGSPKKRRLDSGGYAHVRIGDSQDAAGVDSSNGMRVSVEIKAAYGNRQPTAYTAWKDYYVPQCLLHMEVEESECCYCVCWTPTTTRVWVIRRDPVMWDLISDHIRSLVNAFSSAILATQIWKGHFLPAAAELRRMSWHKVVEMREMPGSPFRSCFAKR